MNLRNWLERHTNRLPSLRAMTYQLAGRGLVRTCATDAIIVFENEASNMLVIIRKCSYPDHVTVSVSRSTGEYTDYLINTSAVWHTFVNNLEV